MKFTYPEYHAFSAPLEGNRVPTMYCDCLGLITVGTGNLINTVAQALALPWVLADGSKATPADIAADWNKLAAARSYYAARKWSVYTASMRCHLLPEAVDELCQRQLASNEAIFRKRWSAYDSFPADAQLALHSMGWAVGAAFWVTKEHGGPGFVNLDRCVAAQDWDGCVASCKIREEGNPGVVPRNAKNRFCFHNAAIVKLVSSPGDALWWPAVAVPGGPATAAVPRETTKVAIDAQREAEATQTAWDAHPLSRGVAMDRLYTSVQDDLNRGAGHAQREYEEAGLVDEPTENQS